MFCLQMNRSSLPFSDHPRYVGWLEIELYMYSWNSEGSTKNSHDITPKMIVKKIKDLVLYVLWICTAGFICLTVYMTMLPLLQFTPSANYVNRPKFYEKKELNQTKGKHSLDTAILTNWPKLHAPSVDTDYPARSRSMVSLRWPFKPKFHNNNNNNNFISRG